MKSDEFIGLDDQSVDGFRRWALSDWKSPTTRALLAEYYVRCALGCENDPAWDWNYVDITLNDGKRVEVKASAYLQPKRARLETGTPSFSIKEKKWAWSYELWDWEKSENPRRWADCYVFCLQNMKCPDAYDPLNLSQWEFFVLPTTQIDEKFGHQKIVSLGRLKQQEAFPSVGFHDLADVIRQTLMFP